MRKLAMVLIALFILALVVGTVGCGGGEGEGKLPTLNVGDRWVLRMMSEGIEYTTTLEVVGEDVTGGKNCYLMEGSFEPPVMGFISSVSAKIDKATMRPVRMQTSGELMGYPFVTAISYSYSPDATPYPLEVGKELEVIATETTTTTVMGETQTETETNAYTLKVEGIEQITVPAGTFRCFEIVRYDEGGSALGTQWYSDTTKCMVKEIDHETGEVTEQLISYSLR